MKKNQFVHMIFVFLGILFFNSCSEKSKSKETELFENYIENVLVKRELKSLEDQRNLNYIKANNSYEYAVILNKIIHNYEEPDIDTTKFKVEIYGLLNEIETLTGNEYFPDDYFDNCSYNDLMSILKFYQLYIIKDLKEIIRKGDHSVNYNFFTTKYSGDTLRIIICQLDTCEKPDIRINKVIKNNTNIIDSVIALEIYGGEGILVGEQYKNVDIIEGEYIFPKNNCEIDTTLIKIFVKKNGNTSFQR